MQNEKGLPVGQQDFEKDPNDREVRLLRSEVEAARVWYCIPKGKV